MSVRQSVVHRRHARGVLITQIGHLHGGRFSSEHRQPILANVPRQIDQNVDSILTHQVGQLSMRESGRLAPAIGPGLKPRGCFVRAVQIGVAKHLELFSIVGRQQRLAEKRHGMMAKVGRYIPDAQPPFGIAVERVPSGRRRERIGVPSVPGAMLGE